MFIVYKNNQLKKKLDALSALGIARGIIGGVILKKNLSIAIQ